MSDQTPGQTLRTVELQVGGMTCGSCAARIEKKLNRMPGVSATVNYATESAHVALSEGTAVAEAIATVEATGHTARLPGSRPIGDQSSTADARQDGGGHRPAHHRSMLARHLTTTGQNGGRAVPSGPGSDAEKAVDRCGLTG